MIRTSVFMLAICWIASTSAIAVGTVRYPLSIPVTRKATPAELTIIKRAVSRANYTVGDEIRDAEPNVYVFVNRADLNDDERPDLIVNLQGSGLCGSESGCPGYAILATPSGFARSAVTLPSFGGGMIDAKIIVLASTHRGMHDIKIDGDDSDFKWNGKEYR